MGGEADEQPDDPEVQPDPNVLTAEQLWAKQQFEQLGFTSFSAFMLASLRADWHRAKTLLEKASEKLGDEPAHDWVYDQLT